MSHLLENDDQFHDCQENLGPGPGAEIFLPCAENLDDFGPAEATPSEVTCSVSSSADSMTSSDVPMTSSDVPMTSSDVPMTSSNFPTAAPDVHQMTSSDNKMTSSDGPMTSPDSPTAAPDFQMTSSDDPMTSSKNLLYQIDEDFLKEIEQNLSDDEKLANKQKAVEFKAEGNDHFTQKFYEKSAQLYTEAIKICPSSFNELKSILYSNRAAAFAKMDYFDYAIDDCTKSIEFDSNFLKALLRRAQLYENEKDAPEKALQDYETIFQRDPSNNFARCSIMRLQPIVNERNEKLKEEMMGKLKDLGNLFLRPFGLSTENFKLEPNESGGYSVKMQK